MVEGTSRAAVGLAGVPGLAAASTEIEAPVALTTGSGEMAYTWYSSALIIDPAAYERAHPGSAGLTALRGKAVAAGPGADGFSVGDTVGVRIGDVDLGRLPVVAAVPSAIGGGASLLLPPGLVPEDQLAEAPSRTFVTLAPGAEAEAVTTVLAGVGTIRGLDDWLAADDAARRATSTGVLLMVMGLGGLYALIGVVNSVVIASAARRREFAAGRATGLTRGQVVRMVLVESSIVTTIGLLLGALAAAGTYVAVLVTTSAVTGVATLSVPWPLVLSMVTGAFLLTGVTSTLTSWSATRPSSVSLLAARE
ncbi:FtsX-like permease family protein [Micromonospora sp. 4G57]|uniref:FtsX-like permease family protein n=1 Tax=Micromonospora sicca TaxID=2202420 RepID=A0ABU5JLZ3_9ACTN|nr:MULTISPECIES: FtsX-like permease family protein [unclassified Micromonospora]MDZ5446951.1 FtsX-like permease family protein [Micromonospora sp. 4G57]MDZ5493628.1 FtsX-like permease family protein [Micromonospora sp. 4G53]